MILREKQQKSRPVASENAAAMLAFATRCFGTERFGTSGSYQTFRHRTFRQMPGTKKKVQKKKNRSDLPTQTFLAMLPETDYFFFLALKGASITWPSFTRNFFFYRKNRIKQFEKMCIIE